MRYLLILALIVMLFVMGMLQSCGSRAVDMDVLKQSEKTKDEVKSEGSVKKDAETKEESKSETQVNKVDEKQEQRITELYNENGTLKQRVTELLNSKSTDNTKKTKSRSYVTKITTDSLFRTIIYRTKTITIKTKSKDIKTSNVALYVVIGVLGAIALLFGFLYVKVRKKVTVI